MDCELIGDRSNIENLKKDVAVMPEKRKELQQLDTAKALIEQQLKEIKEKGFKLKEQLDGLSKKIEKNKELRTAIDNASKEVDSYNSELEDLRNRINEYREALQGKKDFESRLKDLEYLKDQEAKLNEKKAKILEGKERLLTE